MYKLRLPYLLYYEAPDLKKETSRNIKVITDKIRNTRDIDKIKSG